jgi:hypothetical protein
MKGIDKFEHIYKQMKKNPLQKKRKKQKHGGTPPPNPKSTHD